MVVFLDMCFCINDKCKKRGKCGRALENYNKSLKKDKYFSLAEFKCEKSEMFIKFDKKYM